MHAGMRCVVVSPVTCRKCEKCAMITRISTSASLWPTQPFGPPPKGMKLLSRLAWPSMFLQRCHASMKCLAHGPMMQCRSPSPWFTCQATGHFVQFALPALHSLLGVESLWCWVEAGVLAHASHVQDHCVPCSQHAPKGTACGLPDDHRPHRLEPHGFSQGCTKQLSARLKHSPRPLRRCGAACRPQPCMCLRGAEEVVAHRPEQHNNSKEAGERQVRSPAMSCATSAWISCCSPGSSCDFFMDKQHACIR